MASQTDVLPSAAGNFESAWEISSTVEGWMTREQGLALFHAARAAPQGTRIVEIGSHHGRSTVLLAKAAAAGVSILAVDPYEDVRWGGGTSAYDIFRGNLDRAGVAERVEVFRGTSEQALPQCDKRPIGMLYIDGAHDLKSVLIDIDGWEPYMIAGAVVGIHDAFSSTGVTRAILRRHLFSRSFQYVGTVRSLALFRRENLSAAAATMSAFWVACRLTYFARNVAVKVARRQGWKWPQRVLLHTDAADPY